LLASEDDGAPREAHATSCATIAGVSLPTEAAPPVTVAEAPREEPIGESRWPPALALLVFMALNIAIRFWLPSESSVRVPWLIPGIEAVLVIVLLVGRPAHLPRRTIRRVAVTLVVVLVLAALWATALLVKDLIRAEGVTQKPTELLASGAVIWLGNNLAFSLLYWLMDGGGPLARLRNPIPVDFAFTQQMSPELAPPGWRPVFLDYLHLGFTNATAFSPTDVMPLTHRAKYTMLVQSTVALALFGLIVARAVNAFT
jgi:energy-coupling factor transporter transmembrane protein EcfT